MFISHFHFKYHGQEQLSTVINSTWVNVMPDLRKELVAAAVGDNTAKRSGDIGAVP